MWVAAMWERIQRSGVGAERALPDRSPGSLDGPVGLRKDSLA